MGTTFVSVATHGEGYGKCAQPCGTHACGIGAWAVKPIAIGISPLMALVDAFLETATDLLFLLALPATLVGEMGVSRPVRGPVPKGTPPPPPRP